MKSKKKVKAPKINRTNPSRKDSLEPLQKSDELFSTLFEHNPASLAISRLSDARIVDVNDSFLRLFGFSSKEEVINKTVDELGMWFEPGQRDEMVRLLKEKKKVLNLEGQIRTPKGDIKWASSSVLIIEAGNQPCLLAVTLDITDRKKAEEQVRKMNTELEQLVVERTEEVKKTELKYRSLFEQATDGIFISDAAGKYEDANQSACNMLGYSKEELLKMTVQDILLPAEAESNPPKFDELMTGKTILSRRNLRRKDGSIIPVEINAKMLANGTMMGMVRDITERKQIEERIQKLNGELEQKVTERTVQLENNIQQLKRSEEQLKKSNELFSNLFENNPASIVISRLSDAKLINVNEAFLSSFGFSSKAEVLGKTARELNIVAKPEQREELAKLLRENKVVKDFEIKTYTREGKAFWVSTSILIMEIENERCLFSISVDISNQKTIEEELKTVNKELEAFSYSVSHDLRAPLRSITGYSKVLEEDFAAIMDDEGKRILSRIQQSAKKMNDLIDDLLAFSKWGKEDLRKSAINTELLVQKVISELNNSARAKVDFKISPLASAYADPAMLTQVWINLISNAIKYSAKRDNPVVEIGSYKNENETVYFIKDNGAGFSMEYADKLFGVFQRLHGPSEFEGTGVGLALVKRIVAKHDGRIWAEAKVNEGATFYFSLPENDNVN